MKDIYLGKKESGEDIYLNLEKEGVHFMILAGMSGSGKSIFHNNLYKELSEKHSPEEIGFVFMDMTQVDFFDWKSEYLIRPVIINAYDALDVLNANSLKDEKRTIILHIEECTMAALDKERFEGGLEKILKENKNFHIVYSTSKIIPDNFDNWLDEHVDCRVVFKVMTKEDSKLLLGDDAAFNFNQPGERILAFKNERIKCMPFSETECKELVDFKL